MRVIDKPGIYENFCIPDYHADPCPTPSLNQSVAKLIVNESPAHARYAHPRLSPTASNDDDEKYVAARTIGDVAHDLILGRGKAIEVCDYPDWRTKFAQTVRDIAIAKGITPVLRKHADKAQAIADAFRSQMTEHEAEHDTTGRPEVVLAWQDKDGCWFRAMVDLLSADGRLVTDLKTTGAICPPEEVGKKMAADGWDVQAAMIDFGLSVLDPANTGRRKYRFISIEQNPPFGMIVCELTENTLTMGRKKLAYAIRRWKECLAAGYWPGYPPVIHRPVYPSWAESAWLERESAAFDQEKVGSE